MFRFCDRCGGYDDTPRDITYRGASLDAGPSTAVMAVAARLMSTPPTAEEEVAFADLVDPAYATNHLDPALCERTSV